MVKFLMFNLHGPLAAWGGIAVGERRGSDSRPTKSAVLGILAAAIGLERSDSTGHTMLDRCYGFAVHVDGSVWLLVDAGDVDVVLVGDFADNFLEDVLQRDHSHHLAELVDRQREVGLAPQKGIQLVLQAGGFGDEPGRRAQ